MIKLQNMSTNYAMNATIIIILINWLSIHKYIKIREGPFFLKGILDCWMIKKIWIDLFIILIMNWHWYDYYIRAPPGSSCFWYHFDNTPNKVDALLR